MWCQNDFFTQHPHLPVQRPPSPPSSLSHMREHVAGRNCLSRGTKSETEPSPRGLRFLPSDRAGGQSKTARTVCSCDHSTENIALVTSQTLLTSVQLLNIYSLSLATIFMSESRIRLSCHLQLHYHTSNGYVYVYWTNWGIFFTFILRALSFKKLIWIILSYFSLRMSLFLSTCNLLASL